MPAIRLPAPDGSLSKLPVEKQVQALTDLVMRFRRELEYLLNGNLDEDNGVIKAEVAYIEQIFAEYITTNVLESNTIITNNLTAHKGYIADLTVDELETSDMVPNYLVENAADVNYIHAYNEVLAFITASVKEGLLTVPVRNRKGEQLYWLDATHTGVTEDVTAFPVTIYDYEKLTKLKIYFTEIDGEKIPIAEFGVGNGVGNNAKGFLMKLVDRFRMMYVATGAGSLAAGTEVKVDLTDDGAIINGLTHELTALNIASDSFQATYGSVTYNATLTKDIDGRITNVVTGSKNIPITYNEVS